MAAINLTPAELAKWAIDQEKAYKIRSLNKVALGATKVVSEWAIPKKTLQFGGRLADILANKMCRFKKVQESAALSIARKLGNCFPRASVAFTSILANFPLAEMRCEVVELIPGDHTVLLLNRPSVSDLSDFKTWGDDCYIVDCWAEDYYPATQIETRFYDLNTKLVHFYTEPFRIFSLTAFDPKRHSFAQFATNLYLSSEISHLDKKILILLDELHAEKDREARLAKAQSLLQQVNKLAALSRDPALLNLALQLESILKY